MYIHFRTIIIEVAALIVRKTYCVISIGTIFLRWGGPPVLLLLLGASSTLACCQG